MPAKRAGLTSSVCDDLVSVHIAKTIAQLVADAAIGGPLGGIGVDIPIGLPDGARREADELGSPLF